MALTRIQLGCKSTKYLFGNLTDLKMAQRTALTTRHRSSIRSNNGSWDLYAALSLQRTPQIGPELNWLERRLKEYLTKVEVADSLYSDHEMRHFEDL